MLIREYTISQLDKDTANNFVGDRKERSNNIKVTSVVYVPFVANNKLLCNSDVVGETGQHYKTKISFSNVEYDTKDGNIITTSDNKEMSIGIIDMNKSDVEVSCNCLDFFQRLASYDKTVKALYGNETPKYTGFTRPEDKKKGNPNNSPGMCKHLYALIDYLKSDNVVR